MTSLTGAEPTGEPRLVATTRPERLPHAVASDTPTFLRSLGRRDRVVLGCLAACWAALLGLFWYWWASPAHIGVLGGFVVNALLLAYVSTLPAFFVGAALRLRRVNPELPIDDVRVALVVTKAPSEPWSVVHETLEAMLAQDYPHAYDVWLCDEDPDFSSLTWCAANAVKVSCRRDVDAYHRPSWPRRTRCKEGNLAYFYDHWGYRDYDVVAQLDADHVPAPTYLREMVRPFSDPAVGYVAAPSICDKNAAVSWAARGRLYKEATLHGPMQAGCNDGFAPICIGSHYAVRTKALAQVGGIGPELAEDFTTSLVLCSAGWKGAFAIDAEAHGEGPPTLGAMLTQEFQWSRSLMFVLVDLVPEHFGRLPLRLKARFCYSLSYYPLLAVTMTVGTLLPGLACLTGLRWMRVNYLAFIALWWMCAVPIVTMSLLLRRRGLLRPQGAKLLAWEPWLFSLARWPAVTWGIIAAIREKLTARTSVLRVTPKGAGVDRPFPARVIAPYLAISAVLSTCSLTGLALGHTRVVGYACLSLLGGFAYATVAILATTLHGSEVRRVSRAAVGSILWAVRTPLALSALVLALVAVGTVNALSFVPLRL